MSRFSICRLLLIFGLIASIAITALIAARSTFLGDRVVFGAAAAAFVLRLLRSLLSLGPFATSVVNALVSLMWVIGAIASLLILIRLLRKRDVTAGDKRNVF